MNREKFGALAFAQHGLCSPLSDASVSELLVALNCQAQDRIVDFGCGKGELLIRLLERFPAGEFQGQATGVEQVKALVEAAREQAKARLHGDRWSFVHGRIEEQFERALVSEDSLDLAICMGGGSAFGSFEACLRALKSLAKPGGLVLVDNGYWKQSPAPEYLELLGCEASIYQDHGHNRELGREQGLIPIYSRTSSQSEWDHFEGLYCQGIERYVAKAPEDPDAEAFLRRIRRWREAYFKWGRDTLGYGLYLFLKPASEDIAAKPGA